jgi:hypothetical protein
MFEPPAGALLLFHQFQRGIVGPPVFVHPVRPTIVAATTALRAKIARIARALLQRMTQEKPGGSRSAIYKIDAVWRGDVLFPKKRIFPGDIRAPPSGGRYDCPFGLFGFQRSKCPINPKSLCQTQDRARLFSRHAGRGL